MIVHVFYAIAIYPKSLKITKHPPTKVLTNITFIAEYTNLKRNQSIEAV